MNINQSASNFVKSLYHYKILDDFDYGFNWNQIIRVICPLIRVAVFDLVYTLASTCVYDANLHEAL